MGKRILTLFLWIVPAAVFALLLGYGIQNYQEQNFIASETFFKQSTEGTAILLADKGGSAFLACLQKDGQTHLISILPDACPKGEKNITFSSVFRQKGIHALKKTVEQSLSCSFAGYLIIDISGLSPLVDALGQVELSGKIYSGRDMVNYLQSLPNDASGAEKQQEVILAIGRRFADLGIWKSKTAMLKLLQITETDLSVSTLIKLGNQLLPALEGKNLTRDCLPDHGRWVAAVCLQRVGRKETWL